MSAVAGTVYLVGAGPGDEGLITLRGAELLASADVILTVLARNRQPAPPPSITTPNALRLKIEPQADCGRYDGIRTIA